MLHVVLILAQRSNFFSRAPQSGYVLLTFLQVLRRVVHRREVVPTEHAFGTDHAAVRLVEVTVPAVACLILAAHPTVKCSRKCAGSSLHSVPSLALSNAVHLVELAFLEELIPAFLSNRRAWARRDVLPSQRTRFVEVRSVTRGHKAADHPIHLSLRKSSRSSGWWFAASRIPQPEEVPCPGPPLVIDDLCFCFAGRAWRSLISCPHGGFSISPRAGPMRARIPHGLAHSL